MERLNFQAIEKKWQSIFEKRSFTVIKVQKILLFGNVSLSIRKNSYGPRKKLYNRYVIAGLIYE